MKLPATAIPFEFAAREAQTGKLLCDTLIDYGSATLNDIRAKANPYILSQNYFIASFQKSFPSSVTSGKTLS
jgi:hypothetical protein